MVEAGVKERRETTAQILQGLSIDSEMLPADAQRPVGITLESSMHYCCTVAMAVCRAVNTKIMVVRDESVSLLVTPDVFTREVGCLSTRILAAPNNRLCKPTHRPAA